ncbi:MAG: 50S ribosomal protein L4 [Nanoarchaeota archaeon]
MKTEIYSAEGEKKSEIQLPSLFSSVIRDDIASKYFEAEKFDIRQPYSSYEEAGKRHSASGKVRHARHKWQGHYGKGISRTPRKTMSRRGTQFFWIGAEVSQTRGGRMAHPPKGIYAKRKINLKEKIIAFNSAFAATFDESFVKKRYLTFQDNNKTITSKVIESLPQKSKILSLTLKNIFGDQLDLLFKNKTIRAGKGKRRGRKYKSNAGLLIIKSKDEKVKFSGIEVKSLSDINMTDLYPLGRLTLYTKKAIEEMEKRETKK